jgi:LPXTG-site transpeptidase (sortase) family protein
MIDNLDTLNIGTIRLRKEFPIAQAQIRRAPDHVLHPEAAAIARARIAALTNYNGVTAHYSSYLASTSDNLAPAAPTADLVTDKIRLASNNAADPLIRNRRIPTVVTPILTAAGVFLLVLLLFKAPIIISQVEYTFSPKTPVPALAVATATQVIPAENTITIPKLNIHVPVQYEPSIQEAAIQTALQSGVVHYGNTALPGTAGNVAIFGHSSNDWWEAGNYKFVFVLLDKLSPGDQVSIDFNSKRYIYEVTGSKIVEPTDVAVLNPTPTPTLSLITCTPPGTSLRRLVVTAKQINPDPTGTTVVVTKPASQAPTTIPSANTSLVDQLGSTWNGIVSGILSLFGSGPTAPATSNASNPGTGSSQLPAVK